MHPDRTIRKRSWEVTHEEKPKPGIRPRWILAKERIAEIVSAMIRYSESNMVIPVEWLYEYNELAEYLRNR